MGLRAESSRMSIRINCHNYRNRRADALLGIEISVDQGMSLEHALEIRNRSRFRPARMTPEGVQRHFRAVHRQGGHGVDGSAHAVDRLALTESRNPHCGVQHHHAEAFIHHLVRLAALNEVYPGLMPQAAANEAMKPA